MTVINRIKISSLALLLTIGLLANTPAIAQETVADPAQELGERFVHALSTKDIDLLEQIFDIDEFAKVIAQQLFTDESEIADFMRGFTSHAERDLLEKIFSGVFSQSWSIKFLRIHNNSELLIRLDSTESGHEYLWLYTTENANKQRVIKDIFVATSGKTMSSTVAQATQMMINPSESMIKKFFGIKEIDRDLVSVFRKIGNLRQQGKFKEAYDEIKALPETLHNHRIFLDLTIQLALLFDEQLYYQELNRLAKHYGDDPSAAFILVDYYFSQGNFSKAHISIDRMMTAFGKDGALLSLKANISYEAGALGQAERYAKEAISHEPDFEDTYWTLVTIYLESQRYDEVIEQLEQLSSVFGYNIDKVALIEHEAYQAFGKSDSYQRWLIQ